MTTKTKAKPAAATAETAAPRMMTGAQIVVEALREQGVAEIFGPGASLKGIAQWLETALDARED
jgi:methylmalonyl-CoA mutase cobalamin-binding subunit